MAYLNHLYCRYFYYLVIGIITLLTVSACAVKTESFTAQQPTIDLDILQTLPEENVSYDHQVRPILERRCVVCHGCYDAPCQLKLSSPAGISRGASKVKVYNGARFKAMSPTRLYIDAITTKEWRNKDFHSVLNEGLNSPAHNLDQSVMYKMLRLKQINPQSRVGMLSNEIDLSLGRMQTCPANDEFDKYADKFPSQGMPFGMPNLEDEEYRILVQWLAQGAPVPEVKQPSTIAANQIERWEKFLNGTDNKSKLVARYIYEHLFVGHMHFTGTDNREFYRLVRSFTPTGQPVNEIATVRPYDDPGPVFYYRLIRYPGDIVAKSHVVYELSDQRLDRYRELFIEPDYRVPVLPSWEPLIAANPFKAYKEIPPRSRYRFLLDDARYFIEGFIKGPVCRGMIALNVIEDQFWVTFVDPDVDTMLDTPEFLDEVADYLQTPSVQGGKIRLLSAWKGYRKREQQYVKQRFEHISTLSQQDIKDAIDLLWDGDGTNPNAALTIFRHFDSASVDYGFTGDYPETAWVMDYPLLERIHYLLVAGFNVFDNLKHQLNTRLYMDFLRVEGEDMFLSFLPTTHRKTIRDSWYEGMREDRQKDIGDYDALMARDIVTGYQTDDPQREFYQHLEQKFASVLERDEVINRCDMPPCYGKDASADKRRADSAMSQIAGIKGTVLVTFPDVAFVRVRRHGEPEIDLAYSIIRNKAYKNVSSIFKDEKDSALRDFSNDTLTVVDWLESSYPNFFFSVDIDEVKLFAERYAAIQGRKDYEIFVSQYGTRRTNPNFWEMADWFQQQYLREKPVLAGLFDLNRYQNR